MRPSSLSRWLQSLRTTAVKKPRKAALGLNAFETRDMPSASVIAAPVVEVAHAKVCGCDNHGSKVSEVAKTIGDKVDCGVKPPKATPCNDGSHGKGSADKCNQGSNGKGSGDKCKQGSNDKGSGGKCDNGSSGKGSNSKGSSGKCDNGSSGKGSNCKPSHDKGCEAKVKGNNGVGNGLDPQPPGDPLVNDGTGTSPGSPGNKGGK